MLKNLMCVGSVSFKRINIHLPPFLCIIMVCRACRMAVAGTYNIIRCKNVSLRPDFLTASRLCAWPHDPCFMQVLPLRRKGFVFTP